MYTNNIQNNIQKYKDKNKKILTIWNLKIIHLLFVQILGTSQLKKARLVVFYREINIPIFFFFFLQYRCSLTLACLMWIITLLDNHLEKMVKISTFGASQYFEEQGSCRI